MTAKISILTEDQFLTAVDRDNKDIYANPVDLSALALTPQEKPLYECVSPSDGSWRNRHRNARVTPPIPDIPQRDFLFDVPIPGHPSLASPDKPTTRDILSQQYH